MTRSGAERKRRWKLNKRLQATASWLGGDGQSDSTWISHAGSAPAILNPSMVITPRGFSRPPGGPDERRTDGGSPMVPLLGSGGFPPRVSGQAASDRGGVTLSDREFQMGSQDSGGSLGDESEDPRFPAFSEPAPYHLSAAERTCLKTLARMREAIDPASPFHMLMDRLCRMVFKKDFCVLDQWTRATTTMIENATASAIEVEVAQCDFLCLNPTIHEAAGDKSFPPDVNRKMMRGGEAYVIPSGWCRLGIKGGELPSHWCVAFAGKNFSRRNSLFENNILLPGIFYRDGTVLLRRFDVPPPKSPALTPFATAAPTPSPPLLHKELPASSHSDTSFLSLQSSEASGSELDSERQQRRATSAVEGRAMRNLPAVTEASQSVHYAGLHSQPHALERSYVQFSFQVLVHPQHVRRTKGQLAAAIWPCELPFDPNYPDNELEWHIRDPSKVIIMGLLFREVAVHPFDLNLRRQQEVEAFRQMRMREPPAIWLYKYADHSQPVRFPTGIQSLLNSEYRAGKARSSAFRLEDMDIHGAFAPGAPAVLWDVVFMIPALRQVNNPTVCFSVTRVVQDDRPAPHDPLRALGSDSSAAPITVDLANLRGHHFIPGMREDTNPPGVGGVGLGLRLLPQLPQSEGPGLPRTEAIDHAR
ncbi:unnamed protein product [Vitrella brassicaformis CCMP3155]|uniref:Uncharacterized protein n=1 Tax=Vitrella brassicaformis (strain CCMP3155) TaxID=1169540 RepID=A0A0G4FD06_VITBC|nr:unnamed protein product [Vitrella brassicaformis CCMP3155]|eukprot:CEM11106.1 unnamed protein product [Vitrella brassicaformis CCMP3155]